MTFQSILNTIKRVITRIANTNNVVSTVTEVPPTSITAPATTAKDRSPVETPSHIRTPTSSITRERSAMKSITFDSMCGYVDMRGIIFSLAYGRAPDEIWDRAWLLVERNENPHKIHLETERRLLDPVTERAILDQEKIMWPDGKTRLVAVPIGKRALGIIIDYPGIQIKWRHHPAFTTNEGQCREDMGRIWGNVSRRFYKRTLIHYVRTLPPLPPLS